jgi:hypothetical protein
MAAEKFENLRVREVDFEHEYWIELARIAFSCALS